MFNMKLLSATWVLLVLGASLLADPLLVPTRTSQPVHLDGLADEAAWEQVEAIPLIQHLPVFENPVTERSEIKLIYDRNNIYLFGKLYDSAPEKIQAVDFERDGSSMSNDWFGICLDTFNDNESTLEFWVNPVGMRCDLATSNDCEGDSPFNMSWNTFWDAEVSRVEDGWSVEMRIPFSSLRFQDRDGKVTMGVIIGRCIARKNEFQTFPAIPPKWTYSFHKASQALDVQFTGISNQKPVYLTPYLLGGIEQTSVLNSAETEYALENNWQKALGLDLKYGLTSNLTLDVTVNTDFSQVEADEPQINITRFALFFPEKRLFFQERAGIFNFSTGGTTGPFYSRQIGLYKVDDGDFRMVPIYGGVRLTGRTGAWDIGLLDMLTKAKDYTLATDAEDSTVAVPSENFGVLRLRRQVLNPYSFLGGIFTSRSDEEGNYNLIAGLDWQLKYYRDHWFVFAVAQAVDSDFENVSASDANRLRLTLVRWTNRGFAYDFTFARRGPEYNPAVGFEMFANYFVIGRYFSYSWLAAETSRILRHTLLLDYHFIFSNADRSLQIVQFKPIWRWENKGGDYFELWTNTRYENIEDTLSMPKNTFVPTGKYTFQEGGATYGISSGKRLRCEFLLSGGAFFDGWYGLGTIYPYWNISPRLTVSAAYSVTHARFPDRRQSFLTQLLTLRLKLAFNTKLCAGILLSYNSAAEAAGLNIRLRYNPREGTDLYLVYNEGFNTDRFAESPVLAFTSGRILVLKFSRTFLPKF
jgi:hypothetical protein